MVLFGNILVVIWESFSAFTFSSSPFSGGLRLLSVGAEFTFVNVRLFGNDVVVCYEYSFVFVWLSSLKNNAHNGQFNGTRSSLLILRINFVQWSIPGTYSWYLAKYFASEVFIDISNLLSACVSHPHVAIGNNFFMHAHTPLSFMETQMNNSFIWLTIVFTIIVKTMVSQVRSSESVIVT